jgi:hypothetical protein
MSSIHKNSYLAKKMKKPYYCDAFDFTSKKGMDVIEVHFAIFGFLPQWVIKLMKVRNFAARKIGFPYQEKIVMAPLSKNYVVGEKAGFLTVESVGVNEVVLSAYDKHMDIWISVMNTSDQKFRVSTLVNIKSKKGKTYMLVIKPFHKLVARKSIEDAIRKSRI